MLLAMSRIFNLFTPTFISFSTFNIDHNSQLSEENPLKKFIFILQMNTCREPTHSEKCLSMGASMLSAQPFCCHGERKSQNDRWRHLSVGCFSLATDSNESEELFLLPLPTDCIQSLTHTHFRLLSNWLFLLLLAIEILLHYLIIFCGWCNWVLLFVEYGSICRWMDQ